MILTGEPSTSAVVVPQVDLRNDNTGCAVSVDWPDGEVDRIRLEPRQSRRQG